MDTRALPWTGALRAVVAACGTGATAVGLGRLAAQAASGAPAPDAFVGAVVLALGALAAAVLAAGCTMLAATSGAAALGRRWTRTEALAARLVPTALRRTLTVGLGAGLALGVGTTALADEVDVDWTVTSGSTTQTEPAPTVDDGPAATGHVGAAHPGVPAAPIVVVPAATAATLDVAPTAPSQAYPGAGADDVPPPAVTVQAGDSLWSITAGLLPAGADDARVAAAWPLLYAANRDVVGPDPGLIHPGDVLTVPAEVTA